MGNIVPVKHKDPVPEKNTRYSKVDEQSGRTIDLPDQSGYRTAPLRSGYNDTLAHARQIFTGFQEHGEHMRANHKWHDWVGEVIPCFNWLKTYRPLEYFIPDLLAGISIGFMVVPQAISYATLAAVPPQYGLYGSFLPVFVYAIFGSSRHLVVGPVAVTSSLIQQFLVPLVKGQKDNITGDYTPNRPKSQAIQNEYDRLVTQLAFCVSVIYTGIGVFQLGWVIHLLSHATISGFMTGAALQILLQQIQYVVGYSTAQGQSYQVVGYIFTQIRKFKWQEFVMGIILIAILVTYRELSNHYRAARPLKFLGPITIFILGIMVCGFGSLTGQIKLPSTKYPNGSPLKIVGNVQKGPPKFTGRQILPMDRFHEILPYAITVALIDFTESNSIATALSVKGHYRISYNREIFALGLSNFMGTLFNSYTTTGSFSRSAVNFAAGAKTQISSVISAIIVLFTLEFLTPMFRYVPYNAIGAIIIVGVSNLIEPERAWYFLKVNIYDFFAWCGAFFVTFFLGVEYGLLVAVGISILVVATQMKFPRMTELGEVGDTRIFRPVWEYPGQIKTFENVLVFRVERPLAFFNAPTIRNRIRDILDKKDKEGVLVKFVVMDISLTYRADSTVVHLFEEFREELSRHYNIRLVLAAPQKKVWKMMEAAHIPDYFGRQYIFATVPDAVQFCKNRADYDREFPIERNSDDNLKKQPRNFSSSYVPTWANRFLPSRFQSTQNNGKVNGAQNGN